MRVCVRVCMCVDYYIYRGKVFNIGDKTYVDRSQISADTAKGAGGGDLSLLTRF